MSVPEGKTDWKGRLVKLKGGEWFVLLILLGILGSLAWSGGGGLLAGGTDASLEGRLARILGDIDGAGRVRVMIYDDPAVETGGLFTQESASGRPVGVVVVADGAESIRVRLELIRAVQTLLGLPAEAVEVFQMTPGAAQ